MPLVPLPHRVTILAPRLRLPPSHAYLEQPGALLLSVALFEHLVRHPRVSATDPDDFRVTDGDDVLVTHEYPEMGSIEQEHFGKGRRDELLGFDVSLDPSRTVTKLIVSRFDGRKDELVAIGQGTLSQQIASCLEQWLASRGLGLGPLPLEAFTTEGFVHAAHALFETLRSRREDGGYTMTQPAELHVPFLRSVYVAFDTYTFEQILRIDPDNPWALRDQFLHGIHNDGPTGRDPIRRAIALAPNFGKLYLSMFGDDVDDEEKLHAFAMASILIPGNAFAAKDYGLTLCEEQRWEEATRYCERACVVAPLMVEAHVAAMEQYETCRLGELLDTCQGHVGFLDGLVEREILDGDDPDVRHARLRLADSLLRAGRLQEAIAMRRALLTGLETAWPQQMKVLRKWEADPAMFATLYAREAALRADPGSVLEGFSASAPDDATELSMRIHAHIALGDEDVAAMAYAHHAHRQWTRHPIAKLAGAKALLLTGRVREASDAIQYVALRFPQMRTETAVNRLMRLGATLPAAAWEQVVQVKAEVGALRLARLVARDVADFVPGIGPGSVVARVLAAKPWTYDRAAFAALEAGLSAHFDLSKVEAFFAKYTQPDLEHADRLAGEWAALVPEEGAERAAILLWIFASAFGRYLALTTQAPNVLAGGYRQLASDALEALRASRGVAPRIVFRQLFEGLENLAARVDPWLFDAWLLRFERALDLEANEAGKLAPLVSGFPTMERLLRGDEGVALEFRMAHQGKDNPGWRAQALELFERTFRAIGRDAGPEWSEVAALALPPEQALDVHLTAAYATSDDATPGVSAARILLTRGLGAAALEQLSEALPGADDDWVAAQLEALGPLWQHAKVPVPLDWNQAQAKALEAMQAGDFAASIRGYRYCMSRDEKNATLWRNLGIAWARLGNAYEALAAFARASLKEAPSWAAQALREAGHWKEATLVLRYASLHFRTASEWLVLGAAGYTAEDNDAAALGYRKALELDARLVDAASLNSFAAVLVENGDFDEALRICDRLQQLAAQDPTATSHAHLQRSCALLGLGRSAEALGEAQRAMQTNTVAENQAVLAEQLARSQRGEPAPVKALRSKSPEAAAFRALAADPGQHEALRDLAAQHPGWTIRRPALLACEHRFESENEVRVTPRARDRARAILAGTNGQRERDGALCRFEALRIRENALYPVDLPAELGPRVPRARFRELFAALSGAGAAPEVAAARDDGDPDPLVFPGQRLPHLSDFARVMKGMQSGNPMAALAAYGLDMATYGQLATAWNQQLRDDPHLMAKYQRLVSSM